MGMLRYANNNFEIDDASLFHLDAILSECHTYGLSFQFQVTLGGQDDFDTISITLSPHVHVFMKYANHDRTLNSELIRIAMNRIRTSGRLSIENITLSR